MQSWSIAPGIQYVLHFGLVFLESVDHPEESGLSEAETKTISGMLSSGVGGGDYQSYRESMISSAIVERI